MDNTTLYQMINKNSVLIKKNIADKILLTFINIEIPTYEIQTSEIIDLLRVRADITSTELKNSNIETLLNENYISLINQPQDNTNYKGTADTNLKHNDLENRFSNNCHPVSAITGLNQKLNEKSLIIHAHNFGQISGLKKYVDEHSGGIHIHNELQQRNVLDCHPVSAITNLQTSLDNKSETVHIHIIDDVSNLQTTLDGKANTGHSHSIGNITSLQTTLDGKALSSHTHIIADVTDLNMSNYVGDGINLGATGSNIENVFTAKSGTNLQFKRLSGGTGVSLSQGTNEVTVNITSGGATREFYFGQTTTFPYLVEINDYIKIDNTRISYGISVSSNCVTLDAGKTYLLEATVRAQINSATGIKFKFYNATDAMFFAESTTGLVFYQNQDTTQNKCTMIYTPIISKSVGIKVVQMINGTEVNLDNSYLSIRQIL